MIAIGYRYLYLISCPTVIVKLRMSYFMYCKNITMNKTIKFVMLKPKICRITGYVARVYCFYATSKLSSFKVLKTTDEKDFFFCFPLY